MVSQRSFIINHPNMLRKYANKDEADKAEAVEKVEWKKRNAEGATAASMKIEGEEEEQQQPKKQEKAKVLRYSNPCCIRNITLGSCIRNMMSVIRNSACRELTRCGADKVCTIHR
jgi:hypothetical protein